MNLSTYFLHWLLLAGASAVGSDNDFHHSTLTGLPSTTTNSTNPTLPLLHEEKGNSKTSESIYSRWKQNTLHQKFEIVQDFMRFYTNDDIVPLDYCCTGESTNDTFHLLQEAIDRCPRKEYHLLRIYPTMITLKKIDKNEVEQNTSDNSTEGNRSERMVPQPKPHERHTSKNEGSIPPFLLFALYLPNELFSNDLLANLQLLAPLFPHIKFCIGEANEFSEVLTQYEVISLPKLLFFSNGVLVKKYKGEKDLMTLAVEFSTWTNEFPRSFPNISQTAILKSVSVSPLVADFNNTLLSWFQLFYLNQMAIGFTPLFIANPSISVIPALWEIGLYAISLFYSFTRLLEFISREYPWLY